MNHTKGVGDGLHSAAELVVHLPKSATFGAGLAAKTRALAPTFTFCVASIHALKRCRRARARSPPAGTGLAACTRDFHLLAQGREHQQSFAGVRFLLLGLTACADLAHTGASGPGPRPHKEAAAHHWGSLIASLKAREASWYACTNDKMPASGRPGGALGGAECRAGSPRQRLRPHPISSPTPGLCG